MRLYLLSMTAGWVGSALTLGFLGKANAGTVLVGVVIATLWLAYIAHILIREPTNVR